MYNRFHKNFLEKKSMDPKQFGFQVGLNDLSKSLSNSRSHDIA